MDNEKFIEIVKQYKLLYDLNDKKYCDNQKKDEAWNEIGRKLKMDGKECKKAWALLRDAFRRIVKKRKNGKNTQGTEKKWRYEDEMSFLLPYLKERRKILALPPTCGYANTEEDMPEDVVGEDILQAYAQPLGAFPATSSPQCKRQKLDTEYTEETPSTLLMKYIVESKKNTPPDDIEQFFAGITTTVRSFPLRDRAIAKAKIFEIVSNMEIDILSATPITHDPLTDCLHKKERKIEYQHSDYE